MATRTHARTHPTHTCLHTFTSTRTSNHTHSHSQIRSHAHPHARTPSHTHARARLCTHTHSHLLQVVVCNTIPLDKRQHHGDKIVQLSIAKLLADAITRIHLKQSVSALFNPKGDTPKM